MTKRLRSICISLFLAAPGLVQAQGTTFSYQGRLMENGVPYTGNVEFQPTLWNAASNGMQLAANSPFQVFVGVTNGLFTMSLDFGENFSGGARWLQLEMRTNIGSFTTLSPRQQLMPTPYAITASNLTGTLPATQLSGTISSANVGGTYSSAITLNNAGNVFSGNGSGLTSLNASQLTSGTVPDSRLAASVARTNQVWLLSGNSGTTPGAHFLGTTDNNALELKVNGLRALRLEPKFDSASRSNTVNMVGGSPNNFLADGIYGATIAGGGAAWYLGTAPNQVEGDFGTLSGGANNTVGSQTIFGTVGGGFRNAVIRGSRFATISGGYGNTNQADYATLCGGYANTIQTNAEQSFIGGGYLNTVQAQSGWGTISGGYGNTIRPTTLYATIGGGRANTNQADYATIPGGRANSATNYAFAAGHRAKANHTGSFVWADSTAADFPSQRNDQFRVRADGGARFDLNAGEWVDMRYQSNAVVSSRIIHTSSGGYLSLGGTWVNSSDAALKENFESVNAMGILEAVAKMPISSWNYRSEGGATRHIGPVAQDFHKAFQLSADDKGIATVDADGVALAAIQGLNQKLEQQNAELKRELAELKKMVQQLTR